MISLIQLEYLIALKQYESFSLAAEHCFVTQPTLSMQIKKLENDLDTILFDRTKKPVKPTDIGLKIIEQAEIILAETNKIEEIIQQNKDTISGELRIGIIPSIAPYLLPAFIGKFAKKYPALKIMVKELLSDEIMTAIDKDQIDVGLLVTPLPRKDFNTFPLFYEQILLYCSKDHDFAQNETIDIKQMKDQKIWLMSNGNCFRSQVINLCELKEGDEQSTFQYESASIETLVKLVDKEGGMTLIPELATDIFTPSKKLNVKPFKHIKPVREVSIITNRIFVKKRIVEVLTENIKSAVSQEMLNPERGDIVEWS